MGMAEFRPSAEDAGATEGSSATGKPAAVRGASLADYLDAPYGEIRRTGRELLARPELAPVDPEVSSDEYRKRVLEWSKLLAREGHTNRGLPVKYGGGGDIGGSIAAFETLALGDLSLLVKAVREVTGDTP